jgi:hypothetical protein
VTSRFPLADLHVEQAADDLGSQLDSLRGETDSKLAAAEQSLNDMANGLQAQMAQSQGDLQV